MASKAVTTMNARDMQQVSAKQRVVKGAVQFFLYAFLILMALIIFNVTDVILTPIVTWLYRLFLL